MASNRPVRNPSTREDPPSDTSASKDSASGRTPGKRSPSDSSTATRTAAADGDDATPPKIDPDGLLCALVLVPGTYARNRFFGFYEKPTLAKIRRRAARVRGIIRQLTGNGRERAEIIGERVLEDRVLLRYEVFGMRYARTTSLSPLEAALVRYALHKAHGRELDAREKTLIEQSLARLNGNGVQPSPIEGH